MKYDYLVVGSGLYGAIFAHEARVHGKSVLVVDIFKLEKCGLVKGKSANGLNIPKIEWNVVNLLLDNERHRSLDYIDRILK